MIDFFFERRYFLFLAIFNISLDARNILNQSRINRCIKIIFSQNLNQVLQNKKKNSSNSCVKFQLNAWYNAWHNNCQTQMHVHHMYQALKCATGKINMTHVG